MNEVPPVITNRPTRPWGWIALTVVLALLLVVSVMGNLGLLSFFFSTGTASGHRELIEEVIGGDTHTRNKIAVLYLYGVITSNAEHFPDEEGLVGWVRAQLEHALDDARVKAILVRVNSPGGEVVASDAIYRALAEAREVKPVIAYLESVAASGGYYAAVGAQHIMASDLTITGSIGVILQTLTLRGLMDKVGIQAHTFKSGQYKDLLNPTRQPTDDEKALVQGLIMEVYDKFLAIVARERELDIEQLRNGLADGRILSGKQALDAGFVDELGYFDDAVERAKQLAGVEKAKLVRYRVPFSLTELLRFQARPVPTRLQIEFVPQPVRLEPGKLYFLPSFLFE
ncbi:MAG: signal peptide peptidase SppA [Verrucomicrobiae bacterium]|nr:signal peptide peptidase SppA [Verrucomicrobiae bacterium]